METNQQPQHESGFFGKLLTGAFIAGAWAGLSYIGRIELKPGERDRWWKRCIRGAARFEDGFIVAAFFIAFFIGGGLLVRWLRGD